MSSDRSTESHTPVHRWRQALPAWSTSAGLHALIFVSVVLFLRSTPSGTNDTETSRPASIALVRQQDGQRHYFDGQSDTAAPASSAAASDSGATDAADALPASPETAIDLSGELPAADAGRGTAGNGLDDAGHLSGPRGRDQEIGSGSTRTEVFGISGEGNRFVYVFDRSGSMAAFNERPLHAAKRELLSSLDDLRDTHQFQIIFYNERVRFFNPDGGSPKLAWGNDATRQLARQFVASIQANGATRHIDALAMATRMNPDVIFFLTDADEPRMTTDQLARIQRLNRSASIHTIEFGFGPQRNSNNFLVRLARQNDGQHIYVDISSLKDDPE